MSTSWCKLAVVGLFVASSLSPCSPSEASGPLVPVNCEIAISPAALEPAGPIHEAAVKVREDISGLGLDQLSKNREWLEVYDTFVLPNLRAPQKHLVLTIVGGANSGKSTVFNAIPHFLSGGQVSRLSDPLSQAGPLPGLTRRPLLAVPPSLLGETGLVPSFLTDRFGGLVRRWSPEDATHQGPGLVMPVEEIPEHLIFVDSPDFDSWGHASVERENMSVAMRAMEASDVLVYVFTPETVRNYANLRVLQEAFKRYGEKDMVFIYRVHRSMSQAEARLHLTELSQRLFGESQRGSTGFHPSVIGAYLMPYDEEVAARHVEPSLFPLEGFTEFQQLTTTLNEAPEKLRAQAIWRSVQLVTQRAQEEVDRIHRDRAKLEIYEMAFNTMLELAAEEALEPFPWIELHDYVEEIYHRNARPEARAAMRYQEFMGRTEKAAVNAMRAFQGAGHVTPERHVESTGQHLNLLNSAIRKLRLHLEQNYISIHPHSRFVGEVEELSRKIMEYGGQHGRVPRQFPDVERRAREGGTDMFMGELDDFPDEVRLALSGLSRLSVDQMATDLRNTLNSVRPPFSGHLEEKFREALLEMKRRRSLGNKSLDMFYQGVTCLSPLEGGALATGAFSLLGDTSVTPLLVGANVVCDFGIARVSHGMRTRHYDKTFKAPVEEWYRKLQLEKIKDYFDVKVEPLRDALRRGGGPDPAVMARLQENLLALNNRAGAEVKKAAEVLEAVAPDTPGNDWRDWRIFRILNRGNPTE